jgi:Flp pilus assembly protein TadB
MTLMIAVMFAVGLALLGSAVWMLTQVSGQRQGEVARERLDGLAAEAPESTTAPTSIEVPVLGRIYRLIGQGGSEMSVRAFVGWCVGAAVLALILLLLAGWLIGGGILVMSALVLWLVLARRAALRRGKIMEQLPEFLEGVVRVLSAGNTLDEAFAVAARESMDPVRSLFLSVSRQVQLGAPMDQVLAAVAKRERMRDIGVMSLAVAVNRRYGGGLRAVFRGLIGAVRQRGTAARELRALTAETRFSAMVLAIVSLGLFVYIYLSNPHYYDAMRATIGGRVALYASVGMLVMGTVVIWRMIAGIGGSEE